MTDTLRTDAAVVLATRRELGGEYDQDLVDSFGDRIEAEVERRVRLNAQSADRERRDRIAICAMSLVFGIPLTAIAGEFAGLPGVTVAWTGLAACNVAPAIAARIQRRRG